MFAEMLCPKGWEGCGNRPPLCAPHSHRHGVRMEQQQARGSVKKINARKGCVHVTPATATSRGTSGPAAPLLLVMKREKRKRSRKRGGPGDSLLATWGSGGLQQGGDVAGAWGVQPALVALVEWGESSVPMMEVASPGVEGAVPAILTCILAVGSTGFLKV